MSGPDVSVVIAAHNQARWLGEAVESVRAQTLRAWELLVVDDGSTDDTAAVMAAVAGEPRIRYLPGPHAERAAARNRGIAAARAPLVAFLDADDRWRPDKLARQAAALAARPAAAFCYTPARFIDAAGTLLPIRKPAHAIAGDVFPRLVRGNLVILASVVARRAAVDAVGGFDATLGVYGCEDWDLWLRLARDAEVAVVDEELTLYRRHDGNTSWPQILDSGLRVIDKLYAQPDTARRAGLSRGAVRARHLWYHATIAAAADRAAAWALVRRALRESPSTAFSRPAAGTLAALLLPRPALRSLGRLPA